MVERFCAILEDRGVLEVTGADRYQFLQGLVSNDVEKATPGRALYAALLTAQGKYLHDFFIVVMGESLFLDGESARLADLKRRLGLYKLRAKVSLAAASERYIVAAAFGDGVADALGLPAERGTAMAFAGGVAYVDPRLAELGARLLLPRGVGAAPLTERGFRMSDVVDYDRRRLALGVPDG